MYKSYTCNDLHCSYADSYPLVWNLNSNSPLSSIEVDVETEGSNISTGIGIPCPHWEESNWDCKAWMQYFRTCDPFDDIKICVAVAVWMEYVEYRGYIDAENQSHCGQYKETSRCTYQWLLGMKIFILCVSSWFHFLVIYSGKEFPKQVLGRDSHCLNFRKIILKIQKKEEKNCM